MTLCVPRTDCTPCGRPRIGTGPRAVRRTDASRGFTLIELLLVLVIIGMLAALVGPSLYQRIKPAKASVARAQMENFAVALDAFYLDLGRYPSTQEGLQALRTPPDGAATWRGPYLKKDLGTDPWGHPYVYRAPGRSGGYEISSYGADGREGGEHDDADLHSWDSTR